MVYLIVLICIGKGRLLMSNLFICYPKCTTCQKAKAWLDEHGIFYDIRNIKELNLKEKLQSMPDTEQIKLLATDGMLVKRPILITEKSILVGFRTAEWEAALI